MKSPQGKKPSSPKPAGTKPRARQRRPQNDVPGVTDKPAARPELPSDILRRIDALRPTQADLPTSGTAPSKVARKVTVLNAVTATSPDGRVILVLDTKEAGSLAFQVNLHVLEVLRHQLALAERNLCKAAPAGHA